MKRIQRPKVLFFDVNETLLDLTELKNCIAKVLDGNEKLVPLWFSGMLHHSLVSTVSGHYKNFGVIGSAVLQMVAANEGVELSEEKAQNAIRPIRSLQPHPEVKESLERLKYAGFKMASLTNSSIEGVKAQLENAGLSEYFDQRLSVESVGKYKPHSDVYTWAAKKLDTRPEECMLVAAHGWDIAGALWAGWRAAFISRPGKQLYLLAPKPEIIESNLLSISEKLLKFKD